MELFSPGRFLRLFAEKTANAHRQKLFPAIPEGRTATSFAQIRLGRNRHLRDKDLALDLGGVRDWMITNERFDQLIQLLAPGTFRSKPTLIKRMFCNEHGETSLENSNYTSIRLATRKSVAYTL